MAPGTPLHVASSLPRSAPQQPPEAWSTFIPADPCRCVGRRKQGGLPSSWGIPLKARPGLGTPAARPTVSHSDRPDPACSQANGFGIPQRQTISELTHAAALSRCLRFAPTSHPVNGKTRYRPARYGFDRAGLSPAGFQSASFTHSSEILLPQALLGAMGFVSLPPVPPSSREGNDRASQVPGKPLCAFALF